MGTEIGPLGRAAYAKKAEEVRAARIEDFDFLISQGVPTDEAALRAGWPSIDAAEIALRRAGRRKHARELRRLIARRRSHEGRDPVHVSEVMAGVLADLLERGDHRV
jgi:hypothetical protein